ncbi:MAG: hypothetical protein GY710_14095, partial [Desulfobacteraceae bacterium]|nr:hypothetical protein [Desulfobacteraceae bacterium]
LIMLFLALPCFAGQYKVLKVVDGDTIDVLYMGVKERIRLLNVDTPESVHPDQSKNTPMGEKASAYTKNRLNNKIVELEFESKLRGRYGRLLAYVIVDGVNYNLELIRNGWSPYHTKYGTSKKYHTHFMSAEQNAKAQGLNIWAVADNESAGSPAIGKTEAAKDYSGNVKSLKFHRPGCRYYNCSKCTVKFKTRAAAVHAGYVPCGVCKP